MKPFIRIAFPAGHVYELPTELVARNRAQAMQQLHPQTFPTVEAALEDTVEYFREDQLAVEDWAKSNMNWDEIQPHARLIRFNPPPVDHVNGCEWSQHDDRGLMAELSDNIAEMPVELVLNTMALNNQLVSINVLQHDGQAFAALAMIIGSKPVIDTYIQTLDFTTKMLSKPADPVNVMTPAVQLIH